MKSLLTFFQPRYAYLAIYFNEEKLCKLLEKTCATMFNLQSFNEEERGFGTAAILDSVLVVNVIEANLNNKMRSFTGTCGMFI